MARFHDPQAPAGRVVFGGVAFIDGVTGDITPDEGTRALFAGAGITEAKDTTEPADSKPAKPTRK